MSRERSIGAALATVLVVSSSSLFAQSASPPERWSCNLNGTDVDIRIAGGQATVARAGDTRVLKAQEVRSGSFYTDGTVALKYRGTAPIATNLPQWVQNGQASTLTRCMEVAG
jgi:hypothetical protein